MGIVQAGDDRAPSQVNHLRGGAPVGQDLLVAPDGKEAAVFDRHRGGEGTASVLRRDAPVDEDDRRVRMRSLGCLG